MVVREGFESGRDNRKAGSERERDEEKKVEAGEKRWIEKERRGKEMGREEKERSMREVSRKLQADSQKGCGDRKIKRQWFRMEMESCSENEEFARVAVAVFLSRMDPTLEEMNDIKTAISEAVTNCVIHGYENGEGIIYIEASISGRELTVTIRDEGRGIADVKQAMEPMYTSDTSGERSGMGFAFMEAFMDEVEVESSPGEGTTVTMRRTVGR